MLDCNDLKNIYNDQHLPTCLFIPTETAGRGGGGGSLTKFNTIEKNAKLWIFFTVIILIYFLPTFFYAYEYCLNI